MFNSTISAVLWKENFGLSVSTSLDIDVSDDTGCVGNESEPSHSFEEVDIESSPRFEPLSYTQEDYGCPGTNDKHISISINGSRVLRITFNLATILHQIYSLSLNSTSSVRKWIPKISVDQVDQQEGCH
jgi:hypothetical protein